MKLYLKLIRLMRLWNFFTQQVEKLMVNDTIGMCTTCNGKRVQSEYNKLFKSTTLQEEGKVNILLDISLNIQCRTYLQDIPRISVHWDHSRMNLQMFPLNMAEVFVSRKFYLQIQPDQKTLPSVLVSGFLP